MAWRNRSWDKRDWDNDSWKQSKEWNPHDDIGMIISMIVGISITVCFILIPLAMFLEWWGGFHFFASKYYWFYTPR